MKFIDYAEQAAKTAVYPENGTGSTSELMYLALGLAGEAGEVAEVVSLRAGHDLKAEFGDVLWYIAMMARALGIERSQSFELRFISHARYLKEGFHTYEELAMRALRLCTAACNVANKVKKIYRGDPGIDVTNEIEDAMAEWESLCCYAGVDVQACAAFNLDKLAARQAIGNIMGRHVDV